MKIYKVKSVIETEWKPVISGGQGNRGIDWNRA